VSRKSSLAARQERFHLSADQEHGLTKEVVARRLACSPDHVLNLIASGHLPAVRVPGIGRRAGRIMIMSGDLERCIEQWKARP
jgi:excisionase family DNA binding protein